MFPSRSHLSWRSHLKYHLTSNFPPTLRVSAGVLSASGASPVVAFVELLPNLQVCLLFPLTTCSLWTGGTSPDSFDGSCDCSAQLSFRTGAGGPCGFVEMNSVGLKLLSHPHPQSRLCCGPGFSAGSKLLPKQANSSVSILTILTITESWTVVPSYAEENSIFLRNPQVMASTSQGFV